MKIRLPAEWEEQDGVLLAWPHEGSDWRTHLEMVEPVCWVVMVVHQVQAMEMLADYLKLLTEE